MPVFGTGAVQDLAGEVVEHSFARLRLQTSRSNPVAAHPLEHEREARRPSVGLPMKGLQRRLVAGECGPNAAGFLCGQAQVVPIEEREGAVCQQPATGSAARHG